LELDHIAVEERARRLLELGQEYRSLKGIEIVSSTLVWDSGHPVDGTSFLSRYLEDDLSRTVMWLQTAGSTRGQAWVGPYRDADNNGFMEFAAPGEPRRDGFFWEEVLAVVDSVAAPLLPPQSPRWTNELNFLAWQPFKGEQKIELPAGARVRITMQW